MKTYGFYVKEDIHKEIVFRIKAPSRLKAAKVFASGKMLSLKQFLNIYSVTR